MASEKTVALEASQVQVTTATISIHTLRVGKRQLTQAIFKQLPKCELFRVMRWAEEIELTGKVWGWVNYDLTRPDHRNFVVEKDGRLYRSEFWLADFIDRLVNANLLKDNPSSPKLRLDPSEVAWRLFVRPECEWFLTSDWEERWDELMFDLEAAEQLFIAA